MKLKVINLLLLCLTFLFVNPSYALIQKEKQIVRVALSNKTSSPYEFQKVKIASDDEIKIVSMSEQNTDLQSVEAGKIIEITSEFGLYNIYVDDILTYSKISAPILLSSNSSLQILDLNKKGTPAKYLGMIEIITSKNSNQRFNIVNVIDMQNYVRGVVPNEMPVSFGIEALKAQSIAARNYADKAKMSSNYDLVDTTASQVYMGENSYREISDRAVEETKGIYALYKDIPISALYFSTSPGITDDWDDVFANEKNKGSHPYLKSKIEKGGQKFLTSEADIIEFYSRKDNGLDTNSPKFRWTVEFARTELEEILHNTLQSQSKAGLVSPKYDGDEHIEGLKEIKALKRTTSGKVVEILISAKSGDYIIKKEIGIRRVFKKNGTMLPSGNFFIQTEEKQEAENQKPFSLTNMFETFDDEKYPEKFIFIGGGYGHGVGMSQFGAYNMAKAGKKYPAILKFYYTNITLSTIPKTVLFNEWNVWYNSEFYFDKNVFDNAILYIDNKQQVSQYPFKINDMEFFDTKEAAKNSYTKIDITPYLKQGRNTVKFMPLLPENKGKYVVYKVEFN